MIWPADSPGLDMPLSNNEIVLPVVYNSLYTSHLPGQAASRPQFMRVRALSPSGLSAAGFPQSFPQAKNPQKRWVLAPAGSFWAIGDARLKLFFERLRYPHAHENPVALKAF